MALTLGKWEWSLMTQDQLKSWERAGTRRLRNDSLLPFSDFLVSCCEHELWPHFHLSKTSLWVSAVSQIHPKRAPQPPFSALWASGAYKQLDFPLVTGYICAGAHLFESDNKARIWLSVDKCPSVQYDQLWPEEAGRSGPLAWVAHSSTSVKEARPFSGTHAGSAGMLKPFVLFFGCVLFFCGLCDLGSSTKCWTFVIKVKVWSPSPGPPGGSPEVWFELPM